MLPSVQIQDQVQFIWGARVKNVNIFGFTKQEGHDGPGSLTWVSVEPNYFKNLSTGLAEEVV